MIVMFVMSTLQQLCNIGHEISYSNVSAML